MYRKILAWKELLSLEIAMKSHTKENHAFYRGNIIEILKTEKDEYIVCTPL